MAGMGGAAGRVRARPGDGRLCPRERSGDAVTCAVVRLGQIEIEPRPLRARDRPFVLVAEMIGAAAGADRKLDRRLLHHAVVDIFEPVVEEAQLIAPSILAVERMVMRAAMDAQLLVLRGGADIALGGTA